MREKLATALNSKNLASKFNDCPLDKIYALGIAALTNPIGVDAIRFIDALQQKSYKPLIYRLVKVSKSVMQCDRSLLTKIAEQVVHEAAFSFCPSCSGRKELKIDEKVLQCQTCHGSGFNRHTDVERALAIGVSLEVYQKFWIKRFQTVQSIFSDNYKSAIKTTYNVTKIY